MHPTAMAAPAQPGEPAAAAADALTEDILVLFAREARIDRSRLALDARADELGLASLDRAMAVFEIADRYDVDLREVAPGEPWPTLGELVGEVKAAIAARAARPSAAGALPALDGSSADPATRTGPAAP